MPYHRSLAIHPTPFKPSHLSIPPSPFSPRSPLLPPSPSQTQKPIHTTASSTPTASHLPRPLTSPLHWIWTCHACKRVYPLGATRRCLDDGHVFCTGTTVVKKWRTETSSGGSRVQRYRACASEFDYHGWKRWGRWRRGARDDVWSVKTWKLGDGVGMNIEEEEGSDRDCWSGCDFPSQCRWRGRVQLYASKPASSRCHGAHPPPPTTTNTTPVPTPSEPAPGPDGEKRAGALDRALESRAKTRKSKPNSPAASSSVSVSISLSTAIAPHSPVPSQLSSGPRTKSPRSCCIDPSLLARTLTATSASAPTPPRCSAALVGQT